MRPFDLFFQLISSFFWNLKEMHYRYRPKDRLQGRSQNKAMQSFTTKTLQNQNFLQDQFQIWQSLQWQWHEGREGEALPKNLHCQDWVWLNI